jgi:antitoxin HicB
MKKKNTPRFEDYRFELRPLTKDEGGGILITWPDLPGCMSDGETIEEAIANGRDAFASWMHVCQTQGHSVPVPSKPEEIEPGSGRLSARLPRSLHGRLAAVAKSEGVSINQLLTAILAEGIARRAS